MGRNNDFFRVVLPWPNWDISPNGRLHYKKKARLTRQHRTAAKFLALEALGAGNWVDADRVFSVWIFSDPDRKHRDTGNIRAAMKAYQDGICDALKIDDYVIKDEHLHRHDVKPGGEVELRLYEDYRSWIDDVMVLSMLKYERMAEDDARIHIEPKETITLRGKFKYTGKGKSNFRLNDDDERMRE